jgi:hypothetical protein
MFAQEKDLVMHLINVLAILDIQEIVAKPAFVLESSQLIQLFALLMELAVLLIIVFAQLDTQEALAT